MNRTVFHIGANKTGSTTLQRALFSSSDQLVYLGEDCSNYPNIKDTMKSLISDDDLYFDISATKKIFEDFRKQADDSKTFIYSDEDISRSNIPSLCARRLHQIDSTASIVVIIRNQMTSVPSWYVNHGAYLRDVPHPYWRRYTSFDDWFDYCLNFAKSNPLRGFMYFDYLSLYSDLFGKDKIKILFYEDWATDKNNFYQKLAEILSIDVAIVSNALENRSERTGLSLREHNFHKITKGRFHLLTNRFPLNKLLNGKTKASSIITDNQKNMIFQYYKDNNKKLADTFALDLTKYNYPL